MTSLPRTDALVLRHDYWDGSLRDKSGHGNHGVASGPPSWEGRPDHHLRFRWTDKVTVADSESLRNIQTVMPYGDFDDNVVAGRILSKRDDGGAQLDMYFAPGPLVGVYDGATAPSVALDAIGAKSLAVTLVFGEKFSAYRNGVFVGLSSVVANCTENDAPITIGNSFWTDDVQQNPIKGVLIWNVPLTAAEVAQAHQWIMERRSTWLDPNRRHFDRGSWCRPAVPGEIGAWDFVNVGNRLIDKSTYGKHATVVGAGTVHSEVGDALGFTGSAYAHYTAGAEEDFGTGDFAVELLVKPSTVAGVQVLLGGNDANNQEFHIRTSTANIQVEINAGAGGSLISTTNPLVAGKWTHVIVTRASGTLYLYVNGSFVISAASAGDLDLTGNSRSFGLRRDGGGLLIQVFTGLMSYCKMYASELSAAEVKARYSKIARIPLFDDSSPGVRESLAIEGGAIGQNLSNSVWKFGDTVGRYRMSLDSVSDRAEGSPRGVDMDMELAGVANWTPHAASVVPTKVSASPSGSGTQALRLTYTSGTSEWVAQSNVFIAGKRYAISFWARTDGTMVPYLQDGNVGWYIAGEASTTWKKYSGVVTATYAGMILRTIGVADGWIEYDDISIREVAKEDLVKECTTAGLLYTESGMAGTWEWDIFHHASSSGTVIFMASVAGQETAGAQYGYSINLGTTEAFSLRELVNGAVGLRCYTSNGYISENTWYSFRVTRSPAGQFTMYIKGGAFTSWTLINPDLFGPNPYTDISTTTSKYFVLDLDAGDKFCNLRQLTGVVPPI